MLLLLLAQMESISVADCRDEYDVLEFIDNSTLARVYRLPVEKICACAIGINQVDRKEKCLPLCVHPLL